MYGGRGWTMEGVDFQDFVLVIEFAIGIAVVRYCLDALLFRHLASILLNSGTIAKEVNDNVRRSKITELSKTMWKLAYSIGAVKWVLPILEDPWKDNIDDCFKGWPNHEMNSSMKLFFVCQCGFHVYSIFALLWETQKKHWKDFYIIMSYHIIAAIWIWFSFVNRFFRIGSVILALHNTSYLCLEAAQLSTYSEKDLIILRLWPGLCGVIYLIPQLIISSYQSSKSSKMLESIPMDLYSVFNSLLLMLLVFHIYWWTLFCTKILKQINDQGKEGKDV